MEAPRHWREFKTRYGDGVGELLGRLCPVCRKPVFGKRPVCPACNSLMNESVVLREDAVGVGALIFVKGRDEQLKLLLFNEVDDNHSDQDRFKRERIIKTNDDFEDDVFTIPRGLNTVTGKVDDAEALSYLDLEELPPAFVSVLVKTMLQEIAEEAPGLNKLSAEDVHYFSESAIKIEQLRPLDSESKEKGLYEFSVFVLAMLLKLEDLTQLKRSYQLTNLSELKKIDQKNIRKATLAALDFVPAALLFLAQEEVIEEELIPVDYLPVLLAV